MCGRAAHCTCPEVPGAQTGVVSPCSMTHWLGVQGNASGSSIPAVTKSPIRMQGSAMRHHLRPCTQRGVLHQVLRGGPWFKAAACPAPTQARQDPGISPVPPLSPLEQHTCDHLRFCSEADRLASAERAWPGGIGHPGICTCMGQNVDAGRPDQGLYLLTQSFRTEICQRAGSPHAGVRRGVQAAHAGDGCTCSRASLARATFRLMMVKAMASNPQATPIRAAGATAATWFVSGVSTCSIFCMSRSGRVLLIVSVQTTSFIM